MGCNWAGAAATNDDAWTPHACIDCMLDTPVAGQAWAFCRSSPDSDGAGRSGVACPCYHANCRCYSAICCRIKIFDTRVVWLLAGGNVCADCVPAKVLVVRDNWRRPANCSYPMMAHFVFHSIHTVGMYSTWILLAFATPAHSSVGRLVSVTQGAHGQSSAPSYGPCTFILDFVCFCRSAKEGEGVATLG
jgi:hypothetical protein